MYTMTLTKFSFHFSRAILFASEIVLRMRFRPTYIIQVVIWTKKKRDMSLYDIQRLLFIFLGIVKFILMILKVIDGHNYTN